jgi:hypothetical protein
MHPNRATLEKFYSAFARLDVDTMVAGYAYQAELAAANLNKPMASRKARS